MKLVKRHFTACSLVLLFLFSNVTNIYSKTEKHTLASSSRLPNIDSNDRKHSNNIDFFATQKIKWLRELISTKVQQRQNPDKEPFYPGFERSIERNIIKLHGCVSEENVEELKSLLKDIHDSLYSELDLSKLWDFMQKVSSINLLNLINNSPVGQMGDHIASIPKSLESLAHKDFTYFTERFAKGEDIKQGLEEMEKIFFELFKDKDVFVAFIIAMLIHDNGMLLLRPGANAHAVDGERILASLLDKLELPERIKNLVLRIVGEHAKLYLIIVGAITPHEYERSLARLGLPIEQAYKLSSLLLFLDRCAVDREWAQQYGRLMSKRPLDTWLHLAEKDNVDRLKNNYSRKRFLLFANDPRALTEENPELPQEIIETFNRIAEDDPELDFEGFVNTLNFNLPQGVQNMLRALSSKNPKSMIFDNPNIVKFFYLLAKIYDLSGIQACEKEAHFIISKDAIAKLSLDISRLDISTIITTFRENDDLTQILSKLDLPYLTVKDNDFLIIDLTTEPTPETDRSI